MGNNFSFTIDNSLAGATFCTICQRECGQVYYHGKKISYIEIINDKRYLNTFNFFVCDKPFCFDCSIVN